MIARLHWTMRFRLAAMPHSQIGALVCAFTLLLLLAGVRQEIAAQERQIAAAENGSQTPEPVPEISAPAESVPVASAWLAQQTALRTRANSRHVTLLSATHNWHSENETLLRVDSTWQWRGTWANATHTLIDWLNSTPNLAATRFSTTPADVPGMLVISVETRAWYQRPRAVATQ